MNIWLIYKLLIFFGVFLSVLIFAVLAIRILKTPYGQYEDRYLKGTTGRLDQMFIFLPPEAILYLKFFFAFISFFIAIFFFHSIKFQVVMYFLVIFFAIIGFYIPDVGLKILFKKRIEKFDIQLLEGLNALSNSLKAGFSFPQALEHLVRESKPPLSQEFGLVLKENTLGVSLEKALSNLTNRLPSEDLELVVSSVILTRELGGNLSNIFERLAHTIRERMKLHGKIDALTSQGKMQGVVVGFMPVVLGVLISFISPSMMNAFVNSIFGWVLIGVIIFLEIIGALVIKKIVTIDI